MVVLCCWFNNRINNMSLVKQFTDLNTRAKIVERLYTLYDLKQILNEKIAKAENDLAELDMKELKNGNDKTTKA